MSTPKNAVAVCPFANPRVRFTVYILFLAVVLSLSHRSLPVPVEAAASGLVASYSFGEGSGTTVADSSGNGNTGTISGATWTSAGKFGNALSFNGFSSLVTVQDSASLHLSSGMTLEAWVFPTSTPSNWEDVIYKQTDAYFLEAGSSLSNHPPAVGATFSANGNKFLAATAALQVSTWTHLAATYDGATLILYANGAQIASRAMSDSLTSSTKPLQIGGDSAFGQFFKGTIDEVRVYSRALAPSEIQNDMATPIALATGSQPPTAPSNLSATASGPTTVNLTWTASTDSTGVTDYLIERCLGSGCASFTQVGTSTSASFSDSGLTASTSYSYRVRATDAAGNLSAYSSATSVITPAAPDTTPPIAPTNLTATSVSTSQINLSWTASIDNVGVTGYRLERCAGSACNSFAQIATPTTTSFSDSGLAASTSYSYRVRATDAAGNLSPYSNTATSTTLAGSTPSPITFVQANYASPQSGQTSVAVPFSSTQTAGNLNIVVAGWNDSSATISSVTDSSGNKYNLAVGPTQVSGALTQSVFYAKNIRGATANANVVTVSFYGSAAAADIRVLEYAGLDPSNPFDVAASGTGNSSSSSSPAAVTSNANDLIIGANIVVSLTSSSGAGFTQRILTSPDGDIVEDKAVSATGSYSATAPLSSPAAWIMQMVAFKGASAGSGGPTLSSMAVTPANASVSTGGTQQYTATGQYSDGSTKDITTTSTWSSSNTSVATIGPSSGLATGTAAGATQIAATNGGVVSAPVTLTVTSNGGGGGSAQPALVQHVSSSNTRNNPFSSPNCYHYQLPNFTTAGNAVVVSFTFNSNPTPTVSDDKGNSYTVQTNFYAGDHTQSIGIATAFNIAAGARVISVCFSSNPGGYVQPMATEFANVTAADGPGTGSEGSGTTVTAGNLTPSVTGDLVYQVAFSLSVNQSSFAPGAQNNIVWNMLSADLQDGWAAQYGQFNSTAAINPTLTMGTSENWISAGILLKTGATGGVPLGMHIVRLVHENVPEHSQAGGTDNPFPNPTHLQFPSSGNLLVAMVGGGFVAATATSIIDSNNNTWVQAGATQIQANNDMVQAYYVGSANTSENLSLAVNWSATDGDFTILLYDVAGAAASPLDTSAGGTGSQSTAGNLTMPFTITPAQAGELVLAQGIWDFNTGSGLAGTGWYFDTNTFDGEDESGPEPVDENNGWGHYITPSVASVSITWVQMFNGLAVGNWAGNAVAFEPAAAGNNPPPISVSVSPATASVQTNQSTSFTATVQNDSSNVGVKWTLSGSGCSGSACGKLSNATATSVTYTAPASAPNPSTVTLLATSAADSTKSASSSITVTQQVSSITVTLSPRRGGITTSQSLSLAAAVTNDIGNAGVTWTSTGGTLTAQTATSATFASTSAGAFIISATSNADTSKSASATIGVTSLPGVLTYHNNLSRDGTNPQEFALTPSNVVKASFGKLFSCAVDGEVYAQPLWFPNLTVAGANHNVIFVATENDSVYAFDADANPCHQYWKTSFLRSSVTPVPPADTGESGDINKEIGITGTPVIDPASQTLYAIAKTKEGTNYHQRLHALSLVDGSEKFNGPLDLTSSITVTGTGDTGDSSVGCSSTPGNVPFCPLRAGQRAGLALSSGLIYAAWASHGDNQPYHGWIMSFNASNLQQPPTVFNDSPNGREGGIWMSGGAPAFDSSNNLYVITGNGDYDGNTDFGDSFLKLNGSLALQDWFTPSVQGTLDSSDLDLGSGGAVVLIDLPSSSVPHILVGGGKGSNQLGQLYVVNRDRGMMGKNASPDNVVQSFDTGGMIYSTAAFWQNTMYIGPVGQPLKAFTLNTGTSTFTTAPSSQSSANFGFPGTTPAVSSSATTNGLVWALDTSNNGTPNGTGSSGPAILHAYDATNLSNELWNSSQGSGNTAGTAVKFCVPTVANGKVYIGTQTELDVYGLIP